MVTRRDVWVGMLLYPRHTLPTAAAPVLVAVGLAVHRHVLSVPAAVAAFLTGWFVQLGGVFTDNYKNLALHPDDEEHADFVEAVRGGVVSLSEIRLAIYATYALALLVGLFLLWIGGLPALVVGLLAIAASLAYSAGPYPLGDHALGDPLFFVFFGLVSVAGAFLVQAQAVLSPRLPLGLPAGTLDAAVLVAALPVAALTTNILVIDNIRDLDYDRAKGERTIAVVVGPLWSRVEYCALLALGYLAPLWFALRPEYGARALLPWLTAPYAAVVAARLLRARTHAEMIPLTPQAGQVLLAHSLLFAVALGG